MSHAIDLPPGEEATADVPVCDRVFHYVPPWTTAGLETLATVVVPGVARIVKMLARAPEEAVDRPATDLLTPEDLSSLVESCRYVRLRGSSDECSIAFGALPAKLAASREPQASVGTAVDCALWFNANQRILTGIDVAKPLERSALRVRSQHDTSLYGPELASRYDPVRGPSEYFNQTVRAFAEVYLAHCRVLELGTGTGRLGRNIAPFVRSYQGIEASSSMINEGIYQTNMSIRHGDMMAMPFGNASVDAVIEHESIDFCSEPLLAAAEIERVLAAGGRFYRVELTNRVASEIDVLRTEIGHELARLSGGVFPYWTKGQRQRLHRWLQRRGFEHREIALARWHEERTLAEWLQGLVNASYPSFDGVEQIAALKACTGIAEELRLGALETRWTGTVTMTVQQYHLVGHR